MGLFSTREHMRKLFLRETHRSNATQVCFLMALSTEYFLAEA